MFVPRKILEEKLRQILAEDLGQGDVTTAAIIPPNLAIKAVVIAKEEGVAAGIEETTILAEYLGLKVKAKVIDGDKIKSKQVLMEISGDAQTILAAERTLLNLLSRMSGIATATRTLMEKLEKSDTKVKIAATRKSAPGLLYFDKKAVTVGNGDPHRLHLDDMVLIKDNHIAIVGSVEAAVKKAKANASFTKKIEVEVTKAEDALKAAKAGVTLLCWIIFRPNRLRMQCKCWRKPGLAR